ncbi:MAG: protein-export chaperone SecB [Panacagrimonas sp.]
MTEAAAGAPGATENRQVLVQKIYLKDASLEVPTAPEVYTQTGKSKLDVNLNTDLKVLPDDHYNVVLSLTVTSKVEEQVTFLVEVHQAGIFLVRGFDSEQEKAMILGSYCPNLIFPFARETVADLVQRAGFPQLLLQPINFDALYLEQVRKQQGAGEPRIIVN